MTLGTNKIVIQKYKACCVSGSPSSQDERPYTCILISTGFLTVEIIFKVVKGKILFLVRFLSRSMAIWFLFIETTPKCLHRREHFVTLAAVEQAKVMN